MKAYAKITGSPIIGTAEFIPGTALIQADSWKRTGDGLAFEYEGGTEVDWDLQRSLTEQGKFTEVEWQGQRTATEQGKLLFVDKNGATWTADQIVLSVS